MPRKDIAIWKRKKSSVEARIKDLEALRADNIAWLEKASSNRSETLWRRTEYLKFLQKQQRLNKVVKETALKLDSAKQELTEITKHIGQAEQERIKFIPLLAGLAIIVLLGLGFLFVGIDSGSGITGLVVSDASEVSNVSEVGDASDATVSSVIDSNKTEETIQGSIEIKAADLEECIAGRCTLVFNTTGTTTWVVPAGVTNITALVIGGGGGGSTTTSAGGGGNGGALRNASGINVTPGETLTITVGKNGTAAATATSGGYSNITNSTRSTLLMAAGGGGGTVASPRPNNGTSTPLGGRITGGDGGYGGNATGNANASGGGGAGGYSGNGGDGGDINFGTAAGKNGAGGGGGGGGTGGAADLGGAGGGVEINGQGADGTGGANDAADGFPGTGGSGGQDGTAQAALPNKGGKYGGGAGGDDNGAEAGSGGQGVVVIKYLEVPVADTTAPTITINNPANNNTNYSTSNILFNATISDATIGAVNFSFNNNSGIDFNISIGNWSGLFNTTVSANIFEEGKNLFQIFATDTAGNINISRVVNFTIDRTPPNVTRNFINNPADNRNFSLSSNNQTFNASVFDNLTLVGTVYFWFDNGTGVDVNITGINNSGQWSVSYNVSAMAEEKQGVRVVANDTLNNINSSFFFNFTVDRTPPNVTRNFINNPVDNSNFNLNSNNQTFNASVFDALTLVDTVYFWFDNGTGIDINITGINNSGQWSVSYNVSAMAEQKQGVRIVANDTLNNINSSFFFNFTVDRTPPNVTRNFINNPVDNRNFSLSSNNQTFNASVFDNLVLGTVYFWFDNGTGTDINITGINNSGQWSVSYNVSAMAEEKQGVRIVANDTVNNVNSSFFFNFTVDRTPPNVTRNFINNPEDNRNFSLSSNNHTFNASVFDALTLVDTVYFWFDNGTGIDINITGINNSGQWSVSYNVSAMAEEKQGVRVVANDTLNNINSSFFFNFTVDKTGPNVTRNFINNPVDNSNFNLNSNNQTFNASVFDQVTMVDTVYFWFDNGTGVDINITGINNSGQWSVSYNVSAMAEEKQGVRVVANDTLNNVNSSFFFNFTVDRTPPNVTRNFINNPADNRNFSLSSNNQTFNVSVFDNLVLGTVYFWFDNGTGTDVNITGINNSGQWSVSYNVSAMAEEKQGVRIVANDTANNINSSFFFNFTVDRTGPNVTRNFINNPADNRNFSLSSNNQTFNASVFDSLTLVDTVYFWFDNGTGVDINITGINNSGQWSVSYNVSAMAEQKQGVRIVANDTVNNVNSSFFFNFTVDRTGPNVTRNFINNPADNSNFNLNSNNQTFNASVFDAVTEVGTVYFWFDNGTGTDINITGINNSGQWSVSYNVSAMALETQGVRIVANDTLNNINSSFFINFTVASAVPDSTPPNVTNVSPALNSRFNFSTAIEIGVTVNDSSPVSIVNASILLPNGTIQTLTLSNGTGYPSRFNISYIIPNITGFYNVTFGANDTSNNINSTEFTNFTAANAVPVVYFVSPVHSQSITEGGIFQIVNITFNVSDDNGFADIDNSSAQIRINLTGEAERYNTSCTSYASTSTTVSFNCSVSVWYFDGAGSWTLNLSIRDRGNTYAENRSTLFELQSTTAMNMYPTALTWATLELGRTNQTSNNDPIRINNTGNKNIAVGGITVAGYNLQGTTTLTEYINAENFSIAPVNFTTSGIGTAECNGTQMFNGTSGTAAPQSIFAANITRGNNSINDGTGTSGQEELWFCLRTVPAGITRQTYNTAGASSGPWSIAVS